MTNNYDPKFDAPPKNASVEDLNVELGHLSMSISKEAKALNDKIATLESQRTETLLRRDALLLKEKLKKEEEARQASQASQAELAAHDDIDDDGGNGTDTPPARVEGDRSSWAGYVSQDPTTQALYAKQMEKLKGDAERMKAAQAATVEARRKVKSLAAARAMGGDLAEQMQALERDNAALERDNAALKIRRDQLAALLDPFATACVPARLAGEAFQTVSWAQPPYTPLPSELPPMVQPPAHLQMTAPGPDIEAYTAASRRTTWLKARTDFPPPPSSEADDLRSAVRLWLEMRPGDPRPGHWSQSRVEIRPEYICWRGVAEIPSPVLEGLASEVAVLGYRSHLRGDFEFTIYDPVLLRL